MKNYCLGFIFNQDLSQVLLIHKLNPEWQKGKINAVGGKIEGGELPLQAISREVREETALIIEQEKWVGFGKIINVNLTEVHLFVSIFVGQMIEAKKSDAEIIEWFGIEKLPKNIMTNLSWLVPLALDVLKNKEVDSVVVKNK